MQNVVYGLRIILHSFFTTFLRFNRVKFTHICGMQILGTLRCAVPSTTSRYIRRIILISSRSSFGNFVSTFSIARSHQRRKAASTNR